MSNCLLVIALVSVLLIIILISASKDSYERIPTSYYDQGGWVDGPPLLGDWGYVYEYPSTEKEPVKKQPINPFSRPSGFRDICGECVNQCNAEMSLGQTHPRPGENIKGVCFKRCKTVCQ